MSAQLPSIDNEMYVVRFRNGIRLMRSMSVSQSKEKKISSLLQLPFSVYFLDNDGNTALINEEGAAICGFQTPENSQGKSLLAVSDASSAKSLIDNCHEVIKAASTKIFEEQNLRQDGLLMQFLSVKMPWYSDSGEIVGVMGISIVLGKHSLSTALSQIKSLGFLDQEEVVHNSPFKINNIALTKREIECLQLTVRGFTAKQIAQELEISYRTVEDYLNAVRGKAGVNSKSELIKMTIDNFYCAQH